MQGSKPLNIIITNRSLEVTVNDLLSNVTYKLKAQKL